MRFGSWVRKVWSWFRRPHPSVVQGEFHYGGHNAPALELRPFDELRDPDVAKRIAAELTQLELSRRGSAKWVMHHVYEYDGGFITPDGRTLRDDALPPLDEVLGDESSVWFADFRKWPQREFRQAIQEKVLPRIQWIDAALRAARFR